MFGAAMPESQTGAKTVVQKALMPLGDMSLKSGIGLPFGGFSPFYAPYTVHRSYKQTLMMPEGPSTRVVDQAFDGRTGTRTTTVTNL